MIRAYIKNQEMAEGPTSCPRILYNRLWRYPFKPPALLGVIAQHQIGPGPKMSSATTTAFPGSSKADPVNMPVVQVFSRQAVISSAAA
jgi:hypothetical protein